MEGLLHIESFVVFAHKLSMQKRHSFLRWTKQYMKMIKHAKMVMEVHDEWQHGHP
jgi:hypothetical protein